MYRNTIQESKKHMDMNYTQNIRNIEDAHVQGFTENKKVTNLT